MAVGQRGGDHRAGGVVAGDSDYRNSVTLRADPVAYHIAGWVGFPNHANGAPVQFSSVSSQLSLLILTSWVVVALVYSQFRLPVRRKLKSVGDQQGMGSLTDQLRLLLHQRAQLIKRVKRQKLNAAAAIDSARPSCASA